MVARHFRQADVHDQAARGGHHFDRAWGDGFGAVEAVVFEQDVGGVGIFFGDGEVVVDAHEAHGRAEGLPQRVGAVERDFSEAGGGCGDRAEQQGRGEV